LKYDASYFISKFSAIPDEEWTEGKMDGLSKCALGHCSETTLFANADEYGPEARALFALFELINDKVPLRDFELDEPWCRVYRVNDYMGRGSHQYDQPTPKARILAALHDIKAKELQPC
jgi:hypothetical protein